MRLAVTGLGNAGSFLAPLVGRLPYVTHVSLIDFDRYDQSNVTTQAIDPCDVGRPKAEVQAERLRAMRPDLHVEAFADRIENLPLGVFRCDAIASCLDSKRARQYVNERAWQLGIPWVDSGVAPEQMLARVSVYASSGSSACLECEFDSLDYERLEQVVPCLGGEYSASAPTGAPAFLGAAAAALQCSEIEKLASVTDAEAITAKRIVLSLADSRICVSELRRNPRCRFRHETWPIEPLPIDLDTASAGDLLCLAEQRSRGGAGAIRLPGLPFVTGLRCPSCGRTEPALALKNRARMEHDCRCGAMMVATGMDTAESLTADSVPAALQYMTLAEIGIREQDVIELGRGSYFEFKRRTEVTA